MAKRSKKTKFEGGLWIPNHIRNIPRSVLGDSEKMLLAEMYSFGDKGHYKANDTIAKEYMTSDRTVSRWIANILKGGFVYVKNPKGYYRTFWVKSHPEVKAANKLWYRSKEIDKNRVRQNCLTKSDKNSQACKTNPVSRLSQKCPPTNKETNKETNRKTKATPLPLPAGGQAPALLKDRKAEQQGSVEQFKRNFGKAGRRKTEKPTEKEFQARKQAQIQALEAAEQVENKEV